MVKNHRMQYNDGKNECLHLYPSATYNFEREYREGQIEAVASEHQRHELRRRRVLLVRRQPESIHNVTTKGDNNGVGGACGKEIFLVVECGSKGARWDYNYKVN